MNTNYKVWTMPVIGSLLLATAAGAQQDPRTNSAYASRFSASLRLGLNISGSFRGVGSSFGPALGLPVFPRRRTPRGDLYNYDNGYVLTDISGNRGGQTWYWGYDSGSQVNLAANTVSFDHSTASVAASQDSRGDSTHVGAELAYDYQLGEKQDWLGLRYGVEAALNFLPIEFNGASQYSSVIAQRTDTYGYTPGTTPPSALYQGSFGGPNFVLNVPRISSSTAQFPGPAFLAQQHFDANLWGFRLGPYLDLPATQRLDFSVTAGLAAGWLNASSSWTESLGLPSGNYAASGSGHDNSLLWGFYAGLNAAYQVTGRWSIQAGVQYQDLGTYSHSFAGRTAEVDLSKSVFIHAGIGFSF